MFNLQAWSIEIAHLIFTFLILGLTHPVGENHQTDLPVYWEKRNGNNEVDFIFYVTSDSGTLFVFKLLISSYAQPKTRGRSVNFSCTPCVSVTYMHSNFYWLGVARRKLPWVSLYHILCELTDGELENIRNLYHKCCTNWEGKAWTRNTLYY